MIECIVHTDIILHYNNDDLEEATMLYQEKEIAFKNYSLPLSMQQQCVELIENDILPFAKKAVQNGHFVGDEVCSLKDSLKCISTIFMHLSENKAELLEVVSREISPVFFSVSF